MTSDEGADETRKGAPETREDAEVTIERNEPLELRAASGFIISGSVVSDNTVSGDQTVSFPEAEIKEPRSKLE